MKISINVKLYSVAGLLRDVIADVTKVETVELINKVD